MSSSSRYNIIHAVVGLVIIISPSQHLRDAHNIGESLQQKIEQLHDVERAFVHLDFDAAHAITAEHKQLGLIMMDLVIITNQVQYLSLQG